MNTQAGMQIPEGGKARRVYLALKEGISSGRYGLGQTLPGEHRLAESHGVSRVTVRRALEALESDGLIEKKTGAGSIVRGQSAGVTVSADLTTLIPQLTRMGRQTTARLLSFAYGPAPAPVAVALRLPQDAEVQTAQRVRLAEGVPFSHLTTHVPAAIAQHYSEADLATTPLFRLLERSGVSIASAQQSVTATLASPEVADALGVAPGSALLSLTRVVFDADDRGIEHLAALYRPDMFRLEMGLARVGDGEARHWEPRRPDAQP